MWKVVHPYDCLPSGMHKEYDRPSGRNSIIGRHLPRWFSLVSTFSFRTPRIRHIGTDRVLPLMDDWRVLLNHRRTACGTSIVLIRDDLISVICVTIPWCIFLSCRTEVLRSILMERVGWVRWMDRRILFEMSGWKPSLLTRVCMSSGSWRSPFGVDVRGCELRNEEGGRRHPDGGLCWGRVGNGRDMEVVAAGGWIAVESP